MLERSLDRIALDPAVPPLVAAWLLAAETASDAQSLLAQILPAAAEVCGANQAAVATTAGGAVQSLAATSDAAKLPLEVISEALDLECPQTGGGWIVAPLAARSAASEILAAQGAKSVETVDAVAAAIHLALTAARRRGQERRRVDRLEAILAIAQEWSRTNEMEPLLVQMAEAATRLLAADRASIFLWDRPNKTLVARPALGVEGGELRIADNVGVVGQVVHTGAVRRVDSSEADEAESPIDHDVGEKLGYQTRNLICVPLVGRGGEVLGAFEVLNKQTDNFTGEDEDALLELAGHASVALANTQEFEHLLSAHRQLVDQAAAGVELVGESPAIEALRSTIHRVADTELAILILGENGTGKEVVSRLVHYLSRRRDQPWIAVNCAALTETLLESELFGHEKGAFTDAHEARAGKFELASGGTLFLDEIGDLSLGGQAKLLRVLEEKIVVRVGGSTPIHTDTRVVAATNQNLAEMVRHKKFREDLYYRLNVVTLELPPLRERGDDVLQLAEHFLKGFSRESRRKTPKFTAAAKKRLVGHGWPGNVRELRNLMERLAYLLPEDRQDKIEAEDLAFILSPGAGGASLLDSDLPLNDATRRFQVEYIKAAIERTRGNMSDAAQRLGLHRSNLYRKMRGLEMDASNEEV
jgi:Nif-specific regulatory protein